MKKMGTAPGRCAVVGVLLIFMGMPTAQALLPPGARHRNEIKAILEDRDLENLLQSNPIDRIEWHSEGRDISEDHYLIEWQDHTHDRVHDHTAVCSVVVHIHYVFNGNSDGPRVDEGRATAEIDRRSITCQ